MAAQAACYTKPPDIRQNNPVLVIHRSFTHHQRGFSRQFVQHTVSLSVWMPVSVPLATTGYNNCLQLVMTRTTTGLTVVTATFTRGNSIIDHILFPYVIVCKMHSLKTQNYIAIVCHYTPLITIVARRNNVDAVVVAPSIVFTRLVVDLDDLIVIIAVSLVFTDGAPV